jgi:hypothetical protein
MFAATTAEWIVRDPPRELNVPVQDGQSALVEQIRLPPQTHVSNHYFFELDQRNDSSRLKNSGEKDEETCIKSKAGKLNIRRQKSGVQAIWKRTTELRTAAIALQTKKLIKENETV